MVFEICRKAEDILSEAFHLEAVVLDGDGDPVFVHPAQSVGCASLAECHSSVFFRFEVVPAFLHEADDLISCFAPASVNADPAGYEADLGIYGGNGNEEYGHFPYGAAAASEHGVDVSVCKACQHQGTDYESGEKCEIEEVFDGSDQMFHDSKIYTDSAKIQ